jgi:hypothetical protein
MGASKSKVSYGDLGHIQIWIGAVIFGRWAAHAAFVGEGHNGRGVAGWVVTHIKTGRSIPPEILNGLDRDEAEAIARSLDEAGRAVEVVATRQYGSDETARVDGRALLDSVIAGAIDALGIGGAQ